MKTLQSVIKNDPFDSEKTTSLMLRSANNVEEEIDLSLIRNDLHEVDLHGADLRRANLRGADLRRANLRGADLRRANLRGADLRRANLRRANLQEANCQDANLQGANLQEAILQEANLQGANLQEANFNEFNNMPEEIRPRVVDLIRLNLQDADLRRARCYAVSFYRANLQGANLQDAYLREAEFSVADLRRANFRGADLQEAYCQDANFQGAIFIGVSNINLEPLKARGAITDVEQLHALIIQMQNYNLETIINDTQAQQYLSILTHLDSLPKVTEAQKGSLKAKFGSLANKNVVSNIISSQGEILTKNELAFGRDKIINPKIPADVMQLILTYLGEPLEKSAQTPLFQDFENGISYTQKNIINNLTFSGRKLFEAAGYLVNHQELSTEGKTKNWQEFGYDTLVDSLCNIYKSLKTETSSKLKEKPQEEIEEEIEKAQDELSSRLLNTNITSRSDFAKICSQVPELDRAFKKNNLDQVIHSKNKFGYIAANMLEVQNAVGIQTSELAKIYSRTPESDQEFKKTQSGLVTFFQNKLTDNDNIAADILAAQEIVDSVIIERPQKAGNPFIICGDLFTISNATSTTDVTKKSPILEITAKGRGYLKSQNNLIYLNHPQYEMFNYLITQLNPTYASENQDDQFAKNVKPDATSKKPSSTTTITKKIISIPDRAELRIGSKEFVKELNKRSENRQVSMSM